MNRILGFYLDWTRNCENFLEIAAILVPMGFWPISIGKISVSDPRRLGRMGRVCFFPFFGNSFGSLRKRRRSGKDLPETAVVWVLLKRSRRVKEKSGFGRHVAEEVRAGEKTGGERNRGIAMKKKV